ncbi:unnamed protein product [Periconia digitata]|uniref:Uncharacterized protein n=1 Tax=Periconia digitata TaxID=1303443 RepID=A0A9W4XT63_9PLEO|nr:unnamed protein product [Periconia digitata]
MVYQTWWSWGSADGAMRSSAFRLPGVRWGRGRVDLHHLHLGLNNQLIIITFSRICSNLIKRIMLFQHYGNRGISKPERRINAIANLDGVFIKSCLSKHAALFLFQGAATRLTGAA